ncbi:MAG: hypothetical protein FJX02_07125 [Alphaproteobacteria bacterium]|nr:hypothetical protein [Alphaproteobacteria bacterium]
MELTRRRLAAVLGSTALAGGAVPAGASTRPTFIFVEADDCEPCKRWHANEAHWWRQAPEHARVQTIFLRAPRAREAYRDANWPEELRRFRDLPGAPRATPAFFVITGGALVTMTSGYSAWRRDVLPTVRQLVAGSGTPARRA